MLVYQTCGTTQPLDFGRSGRIGRSVRTLSFRVVRGVSGFLPDLKLFCFTKFLHDKLMLFVHFQVSHAVQVLC